MLTADVSIAIAIPAAHTIEFNVFIIVACLQFFYLVSVPVTYFCFPDPRLGLGTRLLSERFDLFIRRQVLEKNNRTNLNGLMRLGGGLNCVEGV